MFVQVWPATFDRRIETMFDIAFIESEPTYIDDDGWSGLWGRIVLGD